MVASFVNIRTLTLEELSGVVNLYPWYGAARVELCRRMNALGKGLGEEEFAAHALYIPDRGKLAALLRDSRRADCSDAEVNTLLSAYLEPVQATAGTVHAVGGDYFTQEQYDRVREGADNVFSRMGRTRSESDAREGVSSDLPERFATETLARIFVEQGRAEEARRIYGRLILDFPEKSAYFASLIDNLDN